MGRIDSHPHNINTVEHKIHPPMATNIPGGVDTDTLHPVLTHQLVHPLSQVTTENESGADTLEDTHFTDLENFDIYEDTVLSPSGSTPGQEVNQDADLPSPNLLREADLPSPILLREADLPSPNLLREAYLANYEADLPSQGGWADLPSEGGSSQDSNPTQKSPGVSPPPPQVEYSTLDPLTKHTITDEDFEWD